ncbi:MAG: hypothetical protein M3R00_03645, partial [Pseudomonadota bacterium]|nr:hypothetical protein [Pseudomonadota bacterium]
CEKNIPKAYELIAQLLNSDNDFIRKLALEMFENIPAPYNKTNQYNSILGSLYRKLGQFNAAIMRFTQADEFTPELQREIFLEMARAKVGDAEETLTAYERAANAGSAEAWIHIGDCYRDGKIGKLSNYNKAIECYCHAALTPNGFSKAVPSFDYLLTWQGISEETKTRIRQHIMELQFQLYVVDKIELTT